MIKAHVRYRKSDGGIVGVIDVDDAIAPMHETVDIGLLPLPPGADPLSIRVLAGAVVPRDVCAITSSGNVLHGCPADVFVTGCGFAWAGNDVVLSVPAGQSVMVHLSSQTSICNPSSLATTPLLADLKAALLTQIDDAAGAARAKHITTVAGQEATYIAKETDARRYLEDGRIGPWLAAEVLATGLQAQQCAQAIIATADAWAHIGAAIERERRSGKLGVAASVTHAEAASAATGAKQAIAQAAA